MNLEVVKLIGAEARPYVEELAQLRLKVFWDYPYLYEGSLDYEKNYLETYFKARYSFILLLKDKGEVIGATTGIWAQEEEESFKLPFILHGLDPATIFYFGESVLLEKYRGQGLGRLFFKEREDYARELGFIEYLSFCAVERKSHPLRPAHYRPLDSFWEAQGFKKVAGLVTQYEWRDRGDERPSEKSMQYWMKKI